MINPTEISTERIVPIAFLALVVVYWIYSKIKLKKLLKTSGKDAVMEEIRRNDPYRIG